MPDKALTDLIIQKPVFKLNEALNINYYDFFISLGKAGLSGAIGNTSGIADNVLDALREIKSDDKPEYLAWSLISTALSNTLDELVIEYHDLFETEPSDEAMAELADRVTYTLNAIEVSIDISFFNEPQNLPLLDDFKSALDFWLQGFGWNQAQADAFHARFKSRFVFALHNAWIHSPVEFQSLEQRLNTPFADKAAEQRDWILYTASLRELANERVFNEAFSLKQVYVPLNAFYKEERKTNDNTKIVNVVVDLHSYMHDWLKRFDRDDSLKVICGGPGCGKSSFSKVFVAEVAKKAEIPVLFISLHHFDPSKDLMTAVEDFIQYNEFLSVNPLDPKGHERLLIVFDGLDELSMQSTAASEVAQNFVAEVTSALDRFNSNDRVKRQAIITGRDIAVQASEQRLRKEQQILNMLPYFLNDEERENYEEKEDLLEKDLRNNWWCKFSQAKGKTYQAMPSALQKENLTPITREPLLNYLIALSYEVGDVEFNESITLNTIYQDLLKEVYHRQWDGRLHKGTEDLKEQEFFRILEEIALAVWHGNGRTATEPAIYKRCKNSNLIRYLKKFSEGAEKGVVRLLTAFYFREFGKESSGDRVFEFTHKSFGEFLMAKRIVRAVEDIQDEVERHEKNPDKGYNIREALVVWARICGPTAMDKYLYQFIKDEIIAQDLVDISKWQYTFIKMLGSAVRESMPMEKLELPSFAEMQKQSRNAIEGLLAIHAACFEKTNKILDSNWDNSTAFGTCWKQLQGQHSRTNNPLTDNLLIGLSLESLNFDMADFYGAKLAKSNLANTGLYGVNLQKADLQGADLTDSNLTGSNLRDAVLIDANLTDADLTDTHLEGAVLIDANLKGADLSGAHLQGAILRDANLTGAHLSEGVDLRGANLEGANLRDADLEGSDLRDANLINSNLEGADLYIANLDGADLRDANLRYANLEGADLKGADLREANLEGTDLEGADLREADLEGTGLEGADLREALGKML